MLKRLQDEAWLLGDENDGFASLGSALFYNSYGLSEYHFDILYSSFAAVLGPREKYNRWFAVGANFAVTRQAVLRLSKTEYVKLLEALYEADTTVRKHEPHHYVEGHLMEQFWPVVFRSNCVRGKYYACVYNKGAGLEYTKMPPANPPFIL